MNSKNTTLLQFNNLSLTFADKLILENISASIVASEKIGLIGRNGSGKTSLLKCLSGFINSYSGNIHKNCKIEYVPQLDLELYRKKIPLYNYLEDMHENWWEVLHIYERIFGTVIAEDIILSKLSGGELSRLNISISIAKSPDLILLDEPTNHLDLRSLKQLELFLKESNLTFVLVSHNINFLNNVINEIWQIENGKLNMYGGNYNFYKEQKLIQAKNINKDIKAIEKQITRIQDTSLKKYSQARSTDKKFTSRDPYIKKLAGKKARTAKVLKNRSDKKIDELEKQKAQLLKKHIILDLNSIDRSGLIVSISNGSLKLPNKTELIRNISLNINHGDRIAIMGNNGVGKTSFVKELEYNNRHVLEGDIRYGSQYKTLFVDQKYDLVNPKLTIIDNILVNNKGISYENVRKVLGNLGFSDNYNIAQLAETLSGGEMARLAFAIATTTPIEMLILDEPTNNLDTDTIEVISNSLNKYNGTLIIISHDMGFLESIGIERYFVIKDKNLITYDEVG